MKLMHLSDLHLGKRLNEFSLLEDQSFILQQLVELVVVVVQALYQEDHGFLYFELVNQPLYPQELLQLLGML